MLAALLISAMFLPRVELTHSSFTLNRGQWHEDVVARMASPGFTTWITSTGAVFEQASDSGKGHVTKITFQGATRERSVEPIAELTTVTSYFQSNASATVAPVVREVTIPDLYPGVDCRWLATSSGPRFDFIVHPNAHPDALRLKIEGAIAIKTASDAIEALTSLGTITVGGLQTYEQDQSRILPSSFKLIDKNTVQIEIPRLRPNTIVVDPVVSATFFGGTSTDVPFALRRGPDGTHYVLGYTESINLPTSIGAFDRSFNGVGDVFVAKFSPDMSTLIWCSYVGGSNHEILYSSVRSDLLHVLPDGSALIACETKSADYPTSVGAYDRSFNGVSDIAVTRLSPDGQRIEFSTYIGGSGGDYPLAVNLDKDGHVLLSGWTTSSNFPTTPAAFMPVYQGGGADAYVLRLSSNGQSLLTSTYLGGSSSEGGLGVAELSNVAFDIAVSVETRSTNFPTSTGAFDRSHNGESDIALVVLDSVMANLVRGTFVGGSGLDKPYALAVADFGFVLAGFTNSSNLPSTPGVVQPVYAGDHDGFIAVLSPDLQSLESLTYLGGPAHDQLLEISIAPSGAILTGGYVYSSGLPVTPSAVSSSLSGSADGYLALMSPDLKHVLFGSYLGGSESDGVHGILAADDHIVVVGDTSSAGFPVTSGGFQTALSGGVDAYLAEISIPMVITGSVILEDLSLARYPQTLEMAFRDPGTGLPITTRTVSILGNGSFSVERPAGLVQLSAKPAHHLRRSVLLTAAPWEAVVLEFKNGDVNGDNRVDIMDFLRFRLAYGTASGGWGWDAMADLNGDGEVSLVDFLILRRNFGASGDI